MSGSKYIVRYCVLLVPLLIGAYWLYTQGQAVGKLPECMLIIAGCMGFLPLAFGFNIIGANGVRKAYARRAGEIDMSFVVYLLVDNDERADKRKVKLVFCSKGFIFDNGQRFLLRVLYSKIRDWSIRNGKLSVQVKDKWVLREYDIEAQNEMQLLALAKHLQKHVPKEGAEPVQDIPKARPEPEPEPEPVPGPEPSTEPEVELEPEIEEDLFDVDAFLEEFVIELKGY